MMTSPSSTRIGAVARRIGCTEGQVYTMTLGLSVAVLLLVLGLRTNFTPAPSAQAAVSEPSAGSPLEQLVPSVSPDDGRAPVDVINRNPQPAIGQPPASGGTTPKPATGGSTPPAPRPCDDDETVQTVAPVLAALKATGVVPSDSLLNLIGVVTGCNPTAPAVVAIGAIAELGSGIPDPGVEIPRIPVPFVELPQGVIDALQPLRPLTDPICAAFGSVVTVILYGFATYPLAIDGVMLTVVQQVLLACGQLRG